MCSQTQCTTRNVMQSTLYTLLFLSAWTAHASLVSSGEEIGPLTQWLHDGVSLEVRRALTDVLGGGKPLLATAYEATLKSSDDLNISRTCREDIATSLQLNTRWAAKFADSSVKLPEGILAGAFTHLGNWYECVSVRDEKSFDTTKKLHGQMCLIDFTAFPKPKKKMFDGEIGFEFPMRLEQRAASDLTMLGGILLRLGVCVPSTCKAGDLHLLFSSIFDPLPGSGDIIYAVQVNDAACSTQESPSFDTSDWVAVGILTFLGAILVGSTTYDVVLPTERKRTIFTAFSIVSNGKKMLAAPRPGGDTTLSCLHGIRFISMCWVVLGHRYTAQATRPVINLLYYFDYINSVWRVGLMNAFFSVDTFFVLSGLLVAYLFFKIPPASRQINVPLFYLHRYIRLTPAFAMMILFSSSLLYHVGWGPLWQTQMDGGREDCQKSWWNNLLYVNNYVNPEVSCVGQSWYLMVDMQLHWLSPIIIILLHKVPRIGQVTLALLCVGGLIINFILSITLDIPGSMLAAADAATQSKLVYKYYITTYTRFVPYLEGFAVGYFLATQELNNGKRKKFPMIVSLASWLIVAALLLVPLFLGYYFYQTPLPSKIETAFYNSLSRPIWSLGVVGVIYLCASGQGGPVNILLSWTGFQILGRFSYGIFLVHMAVISAQSASSKTYSYLSDSVILPAFVGDLVVCLLCAAILSLVCESPFLIIEKELLGGRNIKKKTKNPHLQTIRSSETEDEKISVPNV